MGGVSTRVVQPFPQLTVGKERLSRNMEARLDPYCELGETGKAEARYRDWMTADPRWGWGWIGWSDCYRFTRTELRGCGRCEQLLREGLAIDEVRDRSEIVDGLADACEEQGRAEETKEFRRQAKRSAAAMETSLNVSSAGTVLRQKTKIDFGDQGLPLSEMSNVVARLRGTSAPAIVGKPKVGRNDPCPCRSGKRFKKCGRY